MRAKATSRQAARSRTRAAAAKTVRRPARGPLPSARRRWSGRTARDPFRSLEALFEHSPDAVIILDKHLTFIKVNKVYAQSRSRQVSDFPGRKSAEFFPGADTQAIFEDVVRTKTPCQVTARPYVFPEHLEWG